MTTIERDITHVTCRWDEQQGVEPGWYCEAYLGDRLIFDSQKEWFPVASIDDLGRHEGDDLRLRLQMAFPNAEIEFREEGGGSLDRYP